MSDTTNALMCPACGESFLPPCDALRCFCPHCGRPVDVAQARAIEEMLRSAQETARTAQETALQAQRAALQAEQAAEESRRQAEEQAAAFAADRKAMEERRRAAEREASEQAARKMAAEQKAQRKWAAEREAAAQRTREAASESKQNTAQAETQAPAPLSYRRDATVRDDATGHGLFVVTLPTTWSVDETRLRRVDSSSQPYRPFASFTDESGSLITLRVDDGGMQMSDGMKAVMRTYGSALAAQDRTNYAHMPNPLRLADNHMLEFTGKVGATGLCLVREWGSPDLVARKEEARQLFHEVARASGPALLKDPFAAEFVRIYEFVYNGVRRSTAVYVRLFAIKDASGVDLMPVGLAGSLGGAIGGAIGNIIARKKASSSGAQRAAPQGPIRTAKAPAWSTSDFDDYTKGGSIYWSIQGFATLNSRTEIFEQQFEQAFLPFARTFRIHPDVIALSGEAGAQYAASMQQATNAQVARMNIQTQTALAADRQRQAAFDAQLASWHAQSDAHHAAFRAQTNAQFEGYGGTSAPDFSEAIRGVNTFVTTDGREVELDVSADRAYQNQAGDVIGGSGGFDPGAEWTEIPRA